MQICPDELNPHTGLIYSRDGEDVAVENAQNLFRTDIFHSNVCH